MRYREILLSTLLTLLSLPVAAQPTSRGAIESRAYQLLREYGSLGRRPFSTKWPGGKVKEQYDKEKDGTYSYAKFFPSGSFAIKCQRKPSGLVNYESWFGNGKDCELLLHDERTTDYTAYWSNGQKAAKYMFNSRTRQSYCEARDRNGRQTYPPPKRH